MHHFTRQELASLMRPDPPPCVSICMPAHRRFPESQQNAIQYGNLVREATAKLEQGHGKRDGRAAEVVARLESLASGDAAGMSPTDFWNHQADGLAVFASAERLAWYRVPRTLRSITVVADSYHVKPLLPLLYDNAGYHVLGLTRNEVRLHEGNGDHVEEIVVEGVPRSLTDAVGGEWDDARDGLRPHGGVGGVGAGTVFHGHAGGGEEAKEDLKRFFRAVDRAVSERLSRPTGLPLILAAVDHYHPIYREVSRDSHLVQGGITSDPKSLSRDELRAEALRVLEPLRAARVARALDEHGTAAAHGHGATDLVEIARAAVGGRVRVLLLEEGRRVWGRVDHGSGKVTFADRPGQPGDVDVLDDLAELVLGQGGDVLILPSARLPAPTGLAATFRY